MLDVENVVDTGSLVTDIDDWSTMGECVVEDVDELLPGTNVSHTSSPEGDIDCASDVTVLASGCKDF